jgi:hypothetical protein
MAPADRNDLVGDQRMQLKVLVSIDVIERKAGCMVGAELRVDLGPQLRANCRPHAYVEREPRHVRAQTPACFDEIGQFFGRQRRPAFDQDNMQADAQSRKEARTLNRVRSGGAGDHQACRREDPIPMRQLDRRIDFWREPEIVSRDNKVFQSATSRSRRNRKNSIPSRSRRFNISGLRTISPTIEAIFGARK